jgi:hypothetical protein
MEIVTVTNIEERIHQTLYGNFRFSRKKLVAGADEWLSSGEMDCGGSIVAIGGHTELLKNKSAIMDH